MDLEFLRNETYVPESTKLKIKITPQNKKRLLKIIKLGGSGVKMVRGNGPVDCDPELTEELLKAGFAEKVYSPPLYDRSDPNALFLDFLTAG